MTVWELICELTQYNPDAKVTFCAGNLESDSVTSTLKKQVTSEEVKLELEQNQNFIKKGDNL